MIPAMNIIDLVRTTRGEIKPVLSRVREILEPWLGEAEFVRSKVAPKVHRHSGGGHGVPVYLGSVQNSG